MIGEGAFCGCRGISAFEVSSENKNFCTIDGVIFNKNQDRLILYPCGRDGEYSVPEGVDIESTAFHKCEGLTSVKLPESLTILNHNVFSYCKNLTSITLPQSLTEIGEYAFNNCI